MVGKLNSSNFTRSYAAKKKEEALKKIQFCSSENLVFCWGSLLWFSMHHWRFWIQYVVLLIRLFFRWTNKMSDWRYTTQWRSTCRPAPTDLSTFDHSQMQRKCSQSSLWSLTHSSQVIIANLFLLLPTSKNAKTQSSMECAYTYCSELCQKLELSLLLQNFKHLFQLHTKQSSGMV